MTLNLNLKPPSVNPHICCLCWSHVETAAARWEDLSVCTPCHDTLAAGTPAKRWDILLRVQELHETQRRNAAMEGIAQAIIRGFVFDDEDETS